MSSSDGKDIYSKAYYVLRKATNDSPQNKD